jgi:tetratricopeptide (TPR) repeat protein
MEETQRIKLESMFQEADRLINEKAIAEGHNMLKSIIQEDPTFGKAYNHIGWIHETQYKDYANAEKNYKQALEFAPGYFATYYNYAVVLSILQRWADLDALLTKALTVPGINRGTIYNEYGIMYETQGKYTEAIDAYKKYIASTFNNKQVDTAKESIDRCKKKVEILSGL